MLYEVITASYIISAGPVQEADPSHREGRRLLDTRLRVRARPMYEQPSRGGASRRAWGGYRTADADSGGVLLWTFMLFNASRVVSYNFV